MRKIAFIKGFTAITGVIAFILCYGTVGALETDVITIGQAIVRTALYLAYIIAMAIIYNIAIKKAHRSGNSDRQ